MNSSMMSQTHETRTFVHKPAVKWHSAVGLLIRRVRERYCNQSVVTSDLYKVRLQGMSRVPPGVTDYFGRVVRNQLVRRNARALGGGKYASPLPSGTLHNGSGNRGGAGDGYLMPLHTGHVSDGCSGSGSAGALVLCMHGSMTTAEPSPYSCKSRDKRIPIQLYGTLLYGTLAGLVLSLLGIISHWHCTHIDLGIISHWHCTHIDSEVPKFC